MSNSSDSVLFYNVFMRHQTVFQDNQLQRVQSIADNLPKNVAVLVCIELFDQECQELFMEKLKPHGFDYRTASYEGVKTTKYHHGSGLVIFSKYPILEEHFHAFSPSTKLVFEKYAHKGIVAAKIQFPNCVVHVCGTHLHSMNWKYCNSYREKQWQECMHFIESFDVPKQDMLLVGGDMNQDIQTAQNLIDEARDVGLILPSEISGVSLDPQNPMVGTELGSHILLKTICKYLFIRQAMLLDYVFSNQHDGVLRVHKMQNLSDHYAVEWSSSNLSC